ncbi:MAG: ribonuclease III [Cytophagales bacterium]|nr:ribonuclease III [Cytophagales bacterium]
MRLSLKNLLPFFSREDAKARKLRKAITTITRFSPSNLSLYKLALQHSSLRGRTISNERLEFLGDAILAFIIGEHLFKKYPYKEEGFLTKIRARIVNREALNELAKKINLDKLVNYHTSLTTFKTIYGNALEAFIGAIYLDKGYKVCRKFVIEGLLNNYIDLSELIQTDTNYKSKIIEWGQKNRKKIWFETISEKSLENFKAKIVINGKIKGEGYGGTKKKAEQMAAQKACETLGVH